MKRWLTLPATQISTSPWTTTSSSSRHAWPTPPTTPVWPKTLWRAGKAPLPQSLFT
ncbi:hypothetical protein SKAU_G00228650, partial [Synaphobranchus kaupii]